MRTLSCYRHILGSSAEILAVHIKSLVASNHITQRDKIEQFSKNFTFRLSFMASYGLIKRISNSIGYGKLARTFDELLTNMLYASIELIDLSIKLDHYGSLPIEDIERMKIKTNDRNYLAYVLLQNLVINYMYMFDTTYQTKQRLAQLLGLKMGNLFTIDNTSQVKRR